MPGFDYVGIPARLPQLHVCTVFLVFHQDQASRESKKSFKGLSFQFDSPPVFVFLAFAMGLQQFQGPS
jgi:hypothetical protein